jgi:integrin alpha FG-GAP repeat containing protein 1
LALQAPYVFYGLGRTSNYIDTMFYGISSMQDEHARLWQGIIPNSHVAAFPYKVTDTAKWLMEVYITPSGILFWVIIACIVTCLTLAALIGYLTHRENVWPAYCCLCCLISLLFDAWSALFED